MIATKLFETAGGQVIARHAFDDAETPGTPYILRVILSLSGSTVQAERRWSDPASAQLAYNQFDQAAADAFAAGA